MSYFIDQVERRSGVSWRGLPRFHHIQTHGLAKIFRDVLRDGQISIEESKSLPEPLSICVKAGWLHSVIPSLHPTNSEFIFASNWHRRYVESLFYGQKACIEESCVN